MGYTDYKLGRDARKPTAGPLSSFKGKALSSTTSEVKLGGFGKGAGKASKVGYAGSKKKTR
ncbi:MAG: hypothetical protein LBS60_08930 [Deltaproteobacteria bacterium]|jgi:hypothetical protein|nr:hypothetical protein [Deltaproteobacteria bacterium]